MPKYGNYFGGHLSLGVPCLSIEIVLMFGKRNRKENTVRIDVDWLLGESNSQASRDFPWFPRIILSLVCVLAVVWCWPYASRQWLNWEWHQQLAHSMGKQSEDVLPIMLAIHELNPSNSREMVEQLGSSDSNKRTFAYHLLEERIQQWSSIDLPPVVEITSLVESLNSDRIQSPESVLMRAQLAAQLRQLVTNQFPNAPTVIASIDAMLVQGEPTRRPREQSDRTKPKQSSAPTVATTFRLVMVAISVTQRLNHQACDSHKSKCRDLF